MVSLSASARVAPGAMVTALRSPMACPPRASRVPAAMLVAPV